MLDRVIAYLNQPYPFTSEPKSFMRKVLMFTGFVGVFLAFFQPFGLSELPGRMPIYTGLGFGLVTFISMMCFMALIVSFPNYFQEDNWTLSRELFFTLFNFAVVAHANYFFIVSPFFEGFRMLSYSSMMIVTLAVGFIPYVFLVLLGNIRKLKSNQDSAEDLTNEIVQDRVKAKPTEQKIDFKGENEGDHLEIGLSQLLYVQSSGNYIEVVYNDGAHVNKSILRNSISNVEELLASYANIYRCHRKYLVNLNRIEEVLGNSQGYRLVMDKDVEDIPVARGKNVEFKAKMAGLHN